MLKTCAFMALCAILVTTGCVSQSQFLDSKQGMALETAVSRGQFELNCPQAAPTIISGKWSSPPCRGHGSTVSSAPSSQSACPDATGARFSSSSAPTAARGALPQAPAGSTRDISVYPKPAVSHE